MKKIMLGLLALFMTVAVSAQNYSYLEADVRFNETSDANVTFRHSGAFPITEKFGFANFASVEGNETYSYGQVLLGGYYQVCNSVKVSLMAGKEAVAGTISNDIRFGGIISYAKGDKFRAYVNYQRNDNPFKSETKATEWYDVMARYAVVSKTKRSLYVGGRYMEGYGLGVPLSVRQSIGKANLHVAYTHFYDVDNELGQDWTPTVTVALEFL
jgi:hypothetical protein